MPSYPAPVGENQGLPPFWNAVMQSIGALQKANNASRTQTVLYPDQYGNVQQIVGQLNQTVTIGAAGPIITTMANASPNSKLLLGVASTTGILLGMGITGPVLPPGTSVTAIGTNTLTISNFPLSSSVGMTIVLTASGVQVSTGLTGVGTAVQTPNPAITTLITLAQGNLIAYVTSITGLTVGMAIGAADVSNPSTGVSQPAITPGTTIAVLPTSQVTQGWPITLSAPAAESGTGLYCAACNFTSLASITA